MSKSHISWTWLINVHCLRISMIQIKTKLHLCLNVIEHCIFDTYTVYFSGKFCTVLGLLWFCNDWSGQIGYLLANSATFFLSVTLVRSSIGDFNRQIAISRQNSRWVIGLTTALQCILQAATQKHWWHLLPMANTIFYLISLAGRYLIVDPWHLRLPFPNCIVWLVLVELCGHLLSLLLDVSQFMLVYVKWSYLQYWQWNYHSTYKNIQFHHCKSQMFLFYFFSFPWSTSFYLLHQGFYFLWQFQ